MLDCGLVVWAVCFRIINLFLVRLKIILEDLRLNLRPLARLDLHTIHMTNLT